MTASERRVSGCAARGLYTCLLYALMPFAWLRLVWRARRDPGHLHHFRERLGFGARIEGRPIWVHAVSVGELQAALPLLNALLEQREAPILLTTTTPAGRRRGAALYGDEARIVQRCMPWDLPGALRRFFARATPRAVLVLETELWPNLIHACAARSIPLVFVNARLSAGSAARYRRFRALFAPALARATGFAAQTQEDAAHLIQLGAPTQRVTVTGNTKLDVETPADARASGERLRHQLGGAARKVWIAASTHEGEEELALEVHAQVRNEMEDECALILVPRHVERAARVAALVERWGWSLARRTDNDATADTDVLLGDTMGELPAFYAAADVAFVGGSLVPGIGGHNLLEPAALGVSALTGPLTHNFTHLTASLEAAGAVKVVRDTEALTRKIIQLLRDPERRQRMGEAGRTFVRANRGAHERTLNALERWLTAA